jgi:Tol biopolymer transport system component
LLNETTLPNGRLHYFRLSDDSNTVVYRGVLDNPDAWEIFSVPVDGSGPQVKLNGTLTTDGEVDDFEISADSQRVVYLADQEMDDVDELYTVPIGGGAPVKLNGALVADGDVQDFTISPDSDWVTYIADQEADERYELYLAPIDGSAPAVKVSDPLVTDGDVLWGEFDPTSGYLVYYADQAVDERYEIFGVTIAAAPGAPFRLNSPLGSERDVYNFDFSPDGTYLLYMADQAVDDRYDLFSMLMPNGDPVQINLPLGPDEQIDDFNFSPDGTYLLYTTYTNMGYGDKIYRTTADASAAPYAVVDLSAGDVTWGYDITPDSAYIVYQVRHEDEVVELYSIAADGSGTPARLNGPLIEGGGVEGFQISPDSERVAYTADQDIDQVFELFGATIPDPAEPPPPELKLYMPVAIR